MDHARIAQVARAASKLREKMEAQAHEKSLISFVRYVWPVVEPAIPFVEGWAISAIAEHLEAVTAGQIKRLLINVPPGFSKSLLTDVFWPAWEWGPVGRPWYRYVCAAYSNHLTERDNMRCRNVVMSDRYQRLWSNRFKISNDQFTKVKFANDQTGWKLATSVGGIGVGERGDRFIIDDANNTMMMESEAVRNTTNMWFTEVVPDRLNNPSESAIVVIQQRLHEEDVSGTALSREMGYTHLMIPMRYDPYRHCVTVIGINPDKTEKMWTDPRTEDGELAWPERFPDNVVDQLESDKGPYAWCNPAEAPVLLGNLTMKPISSIQVGEQVMGFATGNKEKRARLEKAIVKSISVSEQPVVRMMLASGAVIRCTPNHKWWTGRNDKTHAPYAPAKIGSILSRVCPASLPRLTSPEDIRLAGWLGGFFDGEGSVSVNHRRKGDSSLLISFTQGDGRNGPICGKLEQVLDHFGFEYGVKRRAKSETHGIRQYWLKMAKEGRASRLPLYQKFMHIAQPVKWTDRLLQGVSSGRLYTSGERVVSIEYDGVETVYGLETTTGNYVVWGLASSNSGQYQQTPEPRGGAIIKRDWWQPWEQKQYPPVEFMLASLDSAYTEKEENDPSALTIWGMFRDDLGNPKLMLLYAWEERLGFPELVQKVIETCTVDGGPPSLFPRYRVDKLLIESKASGISVAQEIRKIVGFTGKLGIELINPTRQGDKVARAHSIAHVFADEMIYAPYDPSPPGDWKHWAGKVIDQCASFPKASHDDYVDSTTMAIRYLRDMGFVLRKEEHEFDDAMEKAYRKRAEPLYPI